MDNKYSELGQIFRFIGTERNYTSDEYGQYRSIVTDIDTNNVKNLCCGDFRLFEGEITKNNKPELYLSIDLCTGSDYSGGSVTKSNYNCMKKYVENTEGVYTVYGGYSTYGIMVKLSTIDQNDEMWNILNELSNYPLLDEENHSELEIELTNTCINDELYPIANKIEEKLEDIGVDGSININENYIKELINNVIENDTSLLPVIGTGCTVHIKWDEITPMVIDQYIDSMELIAIKTSAKIINAIKYNDNRFLSIDERIKTRAGIFIQTAHCYLLLHK